MREKRERARESEKVTSKRKRLCRMMKDRKRGGSVGNGGKNREERGNLWDES